MTELATRRRWSRLLIAVLSAGCSTQAADVAPPTRTPTPTIELEDGMTLSDADVASVLKIGCALGLPDVDRIVAGQVMQPSGPLGVRLIRTVETEPTVLQRRTLIIVRADEPWVA